MSNTNSSANPVLEALTASAANGVSTLPPLPYAYEALEPHIEGENMRLHHDKHHQAYVDGLNKAVGALKAIGADPAAATPGAVTILEEDLAFHGSGHLLHSVFWATMGPGAGGDPTGDLAEAITAGFGSIAAFRTVFAAAAAGVKGSGWAILSYEPVGDRLIIQQVKQHDLQMVAGTTPILPLDVWEHAYYLKYRNVRPDYVKAWWNVVNWSAVAAAYAGARAKR